MKTKFFISAITTAAFVFQPCVSLAGRGDSVKAGVPKTGYENAPVVNGAQPTGNPVVSQPGAVPATPALEQPGGASNGATVSTSTTNALSTNTTMPNARTIQEVGMEAEKNSNKGVYLGIAGAAASGAIAYYSCPNPKMVWLCRISVAGLVASVAVTGYMMIAKKKSRGTVAAVSTEEPNTDPYNLRNPASTTAAPTPEPTPTPPPAPDFENDPDWKGALAVVEKLKNDGWKIDLNKGTIVDPKGNKFSSSIASSPAAMSAAGASGADIKAFSEAQVKAAKVAEQKTKGTDNGDMFGDSVGGGGSKSASGGEGMPGYVTGMPTASAGPQLGINRDPAQVAGMKKTYNGEPIGVAADSLFNMIDRRYQLHEQKGSFLPP